MSDPAGDDQLPGTSSVGMCPWCGYWQPEAPTDLCSECSCPTDPAAQRAYIHEREHAARVQRAERWFRIGWRSFRIVALLDLATILLGLWLTDTDRDAADLRLTARPVPRRDADRPGGAEPIRPYEDGPAIGSREEGGSETSVNPTFTMPLRSTAERHG